MDIKTVPTNDSHACCKRTEKRKTLLSFLAGIIAAFLACLCCSVPLIPLMLGISGASSLLSLTKYHSQFEVAAAIILVCTVVYIWHQHRSAGASTFKSKKFWACLSITLGMYAGMSYVIQEYVIPGVSAASGQNHVHWKQLGKEPSSH